MLASSVLRPLIRHVGSPKKCFRRKLLSNRMHYKQNASRCIVYLRYVSVNNVTKLLTAEAQLEHIPCPAQTMSQILIDILIAVVVSACERQADLPGHYGSHTRPQVADRGTPSRSGTRG